MEFVGFDKAVRFMTRERQPIVIDAGLYRVEAAADTQLALTGDDGIAMLVEARPAAHPLELESALAVAYEAEEGDHRLAVLLPGGLALIAGADHTRPSEPQGQRLFGPAFGGALMYKLPAYKVTNSAFWKSFHKFLFGTIEPGTSPTPIAPQTFPPNWVRSTVVTCHVAPAGSYGAGGPGTASGKPPFPPGSDVRRGPFKGYLVSTTPVRVTCPGSEAGKAIELHVTAHVVTLGITEILSMTWKDVYRIVPAVDGPVNFPGVVVATGRVPHTPPPPGKSWADLVQDRLYSPSGFGVPIEFDLYVDGNWVASRSKGYYASYPGGPPPVIADK